ncbi:hypothetical protein [Vibrio owensii]|uniref:hypothetical protein n=1 Tax=Vibrio owensii TaxID=696485 RepID=UPI0040697E63
MKHNGHDLLKLILNEKELSLKDIKPLIVKKHNDYRDYFPLAALVVSGYIKCDLRSNSSSNNYDEKLLASIFFAKDSGFPKVNNYVNSAGTVGFEAKIFTMTAKTQLYFDELKAKRIERLFASLVGIIVGVSSTLITLSIKNYL